MIYPTRIGIVKFTNSCACATRTVSRYATVASAVAILATALSTRYCCSQLQNRRREYSEIYASSLKAFFVSICSTFLFAGIWGGAIVAQKLSGRLIEYLNPRGG